MAGDEAKASLWNVKALQVAARFDGQHRVLVDIFRFAVGAQSCWEKKKEKSNCVCMDEWTNHEWTTFFECLGEVDKEGCESLQCSVIFEW